MTDSKLAHRVLDDCKVSDAEFNEVSDDFEHCMDRHGFKAHVMDQQGAFSVDLRPDSKTEGGDPDPAIDMATRACASGFDAVAGFLGRTLRNPDNLNENEIVAACLVKAGVVDKGYTGADYQRERVAEKMSFDLESFKATECVRDPLGNLPAHN